MGFFDTSMVPCWGQNASEKCVRRIYQSLQYRKGKSCGFTRTSLSKSDQVFSFNTKNSIITISNHKINTLNERNELEKQKRSKLYREMNERD